MDDISQGVWFFSDEGQRIGPVAFSDLQLKAKNGELDPRLDLVWKYGMDQWMPAGEIEGLFERAAPSPSEADPAESASDSTGRASGGEGSIEDQMSRHENWPGARRRSYLIALFVFPWLWMLGLPAVSGVLNTQFGGDLTKFALPVLSLVPLLVIIWFSVRRFINLGMSGWWILGVPVPLLNVWLGYRSFACPAGYAFHKKLDGVGVFLATIYWLVFAMVIVAVAAAVAMAVGAAGSPEMQHKMQEILQQAVEQSKQAVPAP